jgi:protein-disulfide isomerase
MNSAAKGLGTAIMTTALTVFAYNLTSSRGGLSPSKTSPRKVELAPAASEITINLSPYSGLGEDYRKGPDNAKVTIVEFADYQCPGCKHASETLHTLSQEFQGKVRVVFKNYPLDSSCNKSMQGKFHEHSCKAAIMSRCAGEQGKFWQYHDLAFKNQATINEANLKAWATELGMSQDQINLCWNSKDILAKVQDDIEQGNKAGVDSTPTLFINGKKVMGGRSIEELRLTISEQLR